MNDSFLPSLRNNEFLQKDGEVDLRNARIRQQFCKARKINFLNFVGI
jgi:hypothetical protein